MKNLILILIGLIFTSTSFSQVYDDVYYNPKTDTIVKEIIVKEKTVVVNNYNYEFYDDHQFSYYENRINRFHRRNINYWFHYNLMTDYYYNYWYYDYYFWSYHSYHPYHPYHPYYSWHHRLYYNYHWYYSPHYYSYSNNYYSWNHSSGNVFIGNDKFNNSYYGHRGSVSNTVGRTPGRYDSPRSKTINNQNTNSLTRQGEPGREVSSRTDLQRPVRQSETPETYQPKRRIEDYQNPSRIYNRPEDPRKIDSRFYSRPVQRQQATPQRSAPPQRQQVTPQRSAPPQRQQVTPQRSAPPQRQQATPQRSAPSRSPSQRSSSGRR